MEKQIDFIHTVKRENNNKRSFLLLNNKQSKHTPSKPYETFSMLEELTLSVKSFKNNHDNTIIIGFAETATAIGHYIGSKLQIPTIHTTRENTKELEVLFFSEQHSHATEQKIIKNDLDKFINESSSINSNKEFNILFAEDELTTGNTIVNSVNIIKNTYLNYKINFGVVSIINCMSDENIKVFKENNINYFYCSKYKIPNNIDNIIKNINQKQDEQIENTKKIENNINLINYNNNTDFRRFLNYQKRKEYIEDFIKYNSQLINNTKNEKILVLGTEEFMYLPLVLAGELENNNNDVYCQGTTRSPICPSNEQGYIIKNRSKIRSLYNENRITYIYNLEEYSKIIIVTDCNFCYENKNKGFADLIGAVNKYSKDITVIQVKKELENE